jgi:UDP-N-acetyl-D-mannosaminuronic acid dehydrogenase
LKFIQKIKKKNTIFCIIGLGRVGLPLSCVLTNRGFVTYGVDVNKDLLSSVSKSISPFDDSELQKSLEQANKSGRFEVVDNIKKISKEIDVIIITVGTPTKNNNVDYSQLYSALNEICKLGLKDKLIILRSTMPPGTTVDIISPYLESKTKLKKGQDFFLAVCPERILEGHAIKEINDLPEIIGGVNEASDEMATSVFKSINQEKEILHTSVSGAELAKLFANVYRYINFAIANEFAIWAERYGLDANEIIKIANFKYPRSNIPKPGFAGGPCLSKDGTFLDNNTTSSGIISTAFKLNESIPQHVVNNIKNHVTNLLNKKISVLGLSFKANSDDLRDSPSVKLVEILKSFGADVIVHDPHVKDTASLKEALEKPDIVILSTNHREFENLQKVISDSKCRLIYDVWSMYNKNDFPNSEYLRFGSGS